ncbi:Uncharacterized protein OBRU01_17579 [Operophtera brumata]|uniref:dolichyl-phosphate-mannose--protein mannosyltransferase n=1 Tax=Operophtera brumata TaxID=104452 RepID=A0A0L7L0M9_OPEBR|nr:Uncharacterized protein OBRU01_17579 [Operophtera brumata]
MFKVYVADCSDTRQLITPPSIRKGSGWGSACGEAARRVATVCCATLALLAARLHVMGAQLPVFTRFDNPAGAAHPPARHLTFAYLPALNAWLLTLPEALCCDWTMGTVELLKSWKDPRNLATFALAATLGLALLVLPFLPASNLFFPVGFVVAERVLYMPSMGWCLLVAHGWRLLAKRRAKLAAALITFLLLAFSAKTVQPDDVGAHINVGRTYNHLGQLQEAEDAYVKAKSLLPKAKPGESYQARIAPNHLNVFLNLANLISKNATRLEEADMLYRQAISMRADYTQAYINRGDILIKLNRTKEAQEVYERALLYDSGNPDIYYNGDAECAERWFRAAVHLKPDFRSALFNLALLLADRRRPLEAAPFLKQLVRHHPDHCYLRILELEPDNVQALHNLCVVAVERGELAVAERCLARAAALAPHELYIQRHLAVVRARQAAAATPPPPSNPTDDTEVRARWNYIPQQPPDPNESDFKI